MEPVEKTQHTRKKAINSHLRKKKGRRYEKSGQLNRFILAGNSAAAHQVSTSIGEKGEDRQLLKTVKESNQNYIQSSCQTS
ncbi:hypothetical protein OUZ56_023252 [Daphnia magna]|uniref:Uncharacterized protein n=1 Tax=Daphnia magna TaxID=35525 RepID=A0ABR0AYR5_9CRUS|nr:hypothetical protein OUZ56_023252 [Daphnia magna]